MTKAKEIIEFAKTIEGVDVWDFGNIVRIMVNDFLDFTDDWDEEFNDNLDEKKLNQLLNMFDMLPNTYEGWSGNRRCEIEGICISLDYTSDDI